MLRLSNVTKVYARNKLETGALGTFLIVVISP